MKAFSLSKVYQLLEPGPVVLLTTADKGNANVMAMSWHMMVEFEPPLVASVVSSADYSWVRLKESMQNRGGSQSQLLSSIFGCDENRCFAAGYTGIH